MKKLIVILFTIHCSLFTIHTFSQPCLPEGITFTSQTEIDNFQVNYPSCTEILGDVEITSEQFPQINNLNGLNTLESIMGDLSIHGCHTLLNLTGLDNLLFVGGDFVIEYNPHLHFLTGLENLNKIAGSFSILSNEDLTSLNGLNNLEEIEGNLNIGSNELLPNLTGLENLYLLGGGIMCYGNESMISMTGLENLDSIGGHISIYNNWALSSVAGLDNISAGSITGLTITGNSSLSNCEAQSICNYLASPNGIVEIYNNAPGCNNPGEIASACGITLPCLPFGNYYFTSQAQLDNFQVNYPSCNELAGNVIIDGEDINNLNGLNIVTSIGGNFEIGQKWETSYNPLLTSLSGLDSLTYIGGDLLIIGNTSLLALNGMENLLSTGGKLEVHYNNTLESLTGLSNLESVGGNLSIRNKSLINLTGLESLTTIGGGLIIADNDSLVSLAGLENLTSVHGLYFGIISWNAFGPECHRFNPKLESIAALSNLTSIEGGLQISCNHSLTSLTGLENISSISGDLTIAGNDALANLDALMNLDAIYGSLMIGLEFLNGAGFYYLGNPNLHNLNGLNNLSHIGENLNIERNESLTSISSLNSLMGSVDNIEIAYNFSLTSLMGLENIDGGSVNNLTITGNSILSSCEAQTICEYLANPGGNVNISNNTSGCNNPGEIANNCGFIMPCLPNGDYYFTTQAEIDNFQIYYENCTELQGNVFIIGDDITNLVGLIDVTSVAGNLTIWENPSLVNLSGLENLDYIGGSFNIQFNEVLVNLSGLDNLTSIGGNLDIYVNESLVNLSGLDNLTSIGGYLHIGGSPGVGNYSLTSMTGLNNLTSVGGSLGIFRNPILANLTGLEGLTSIGGELSIRNHDSLPSLSGIDNILPGSISNLSIINNSILSTCEVQSICDYLVIPNGTTYIHDNAPGCNSPEEVEDACWTSIDERSYNDKLMIYPNPVSNLITIEFELEQPEMVTIIISNHLGQEIEFLEENKSARQQQIEWNAEGLSTGIYFCVLKTDKGIHTMKIIKI